MKHTHTLAVGAYIIDNEQLLLLFRNSPPYVWAPPGGRLLEEEDPVLGLQREIDEECGIAIKPLFATNMWYGIHKGENTVAVFFLCSRTDNKEIKLSEEHTMGKWFNISELRERFKTDNDVFGYWNDYERIFIMHDLVSHFVFR